MSESGLQWVVNAYALLFGGLPAARRPGGRPDRAQAGLPRRPRALHGRVAALRVRERRDVADRGARRRRGSARRSSRRRPSRSSRRRSGKGQERAKALGVWAAIAVGGGAVGLLLGGILVETLSWPWIFFVNVPVGIATFFLSLRFVPESKDEHAHKSFDLAGAVAVTGGLIALVYGIVRSAESGWGSGEVLGILAVAVVLLARVRAHRAALGRAARPPLDLLACRRCAAPTSRCSSSRPGSSRCSSSTRSTCSACSATSPLEAGLAFLPFTLGIIIGAGLAQPLVPKARRARGARSIGSLIAAAGLLLFLRLAPDSTYLADLLPGRSCSPRSGWGSSSCP